MIIFLSSSSSSIFSIFGFNIGKGVFNGLMSYGLKGVLPTRPSIFQNGAGEENWMKSLGRRSVLGGAKRAVGLRGKGVSMGPTRPSSLT